MATMEIELETDIVIGGSISGLMHALVLKSLGRNVVVLELRSRDQLHARAAGLSMWPNAQKLISKYALGINLNSIAIRNDTVQILDADGVLLAEVPVSENVKTSSWSAIHSLLRNACEKDEVGHGKVSFRFECKACEIIEQKNRVEVAYEASCNESNKTEKLLANLVIAADGTRSVLRTQMIPEIEPQYAGYLAWRAKFPEEDTPEQLRGVLTGSLVKTMFESSYILAYLTPGDTGTMEPGKRYVEWCWYDHCEYPSSTFSEFMTDANGIRHNVTVPASSLRLDMWNAQLLRRKDILPPLWTTILSATKAPLLTAIRSFDNSIASFYNGKVLLVGEAYTQVRPHLGASCDIAALQALLLAEVLNGEKSIKEWEGEVAEYASKMSIASRATGTFGMTGKWPSDYVPSSF
ncbi:FAD/NAD(P)-binding domain-containing protein [Pyrenochaeta sp. DS3sAY3a]|nr:FAD/NAD(P)-binding domain-containing protein [Pyrenochaeta sp. DS3sAY3a]